MGARIRCFFRHFQLVITSLLIAVALCVTLAECTQEIKVDDDDLVFISREDVQEAIKKAGSRKNRIVIVDPRSPSRYQAGHLATAINIPLPDAIRDDPRLSNAKTVYVYGDRSDDPLCMAMCKKLMAFKYEDVCMYQGGLEDWRTQKLPLETGSEN